jgi:ribonuclease E
MTDAPQGAADNGEGPRRRRRRGGRGGERTERGERASRENSSPEGASPADAIESRAAELERAREPEAQHDFGLAGDSQSVEHEARQYDPRIDDEDRDAKPAAAARDEAPPARETKLAYSTPIPPPRGFQAISEHDAAEEAESHRPQRKRRQGSAEQPQPQPLQIVETQVEAAPLPLDDDPPQRTKPRRRRSGPVEAEPLMLVETQPGDAKRSDGAPPP